MNKDQFLKLSIICVSITFLITLYIIFSSKFHFGFFGSIVFFLVSSLFTTIGVVGGDIFCRFAKPDMFLSSGVSDTVNKKIFWMVGPQFIGWIIGYRAGFNLLKNVFGLSF